MFFNLSYLRSTSGRFSGSTSQGHWECTSCAQNFFLSWFSVVTIHIHPSKAGFNLTNDCEICISTANFFIFKSGFLYVNDNKDNKSVVGVFGNSSLASKAAIHRHPDY